MTSAHSFELNSLRNIVEDYQEERPGSPAISVIPSHIGANGATYGYVESDDAQAIGIITAVAIREAEIMASIAAMPARDTGPTPDDEDIPL